MELTDEMTFSERLANTIAYNLERIVYYTSHLPMQRKLHKKYFPNSQKTLDEIITSPSIIFMNTHFSTSAPRPFLPNMIEIGGIHIKPAKPLPKDIKAFLDSATDGAIVFSMGSVIKDSDWPTEKREMLLKVFGKMKQKILWKYENETMPNKPDNVMISQWLPQRDAIAHPNVKLLMGHGGSLGSTEALYEGIPILGIPIFGDQMVRN
jgi:glucuronosyltransferase